MLVILGQVTIGGEYDVSLADSFELIATQLYRRNLKSFLPEQINWVQKTQDSESGDAVFQRVLLSWDGERFSIPKWRGRFNLKAFDSAFGRAS